MVGKWFVDNIICKEPSRFLGQKLKDINPDDLICEEPQIVTFKMINGNRPVLEGETVILNCDVSGIPTPDITVTLPSGVNATVESGGRVTVEANGIITIENITATESGLYVCLAASPGGSTSANLSIYVQGSSSNDNEVEEGGTVPVNVYENDNEVEEGGTAPVNVYENDNEVEEGGTVSSDPVSELYGNEYENDDEDNDRGKMMSNDVEEGTDVNECDSGDEKAKFASSMSVYDSENKKTASAAAQSMYKNTKSVEGTSQLIYGKEKGETATAANLYGATNVDMD
ncbi:biological adhesion [Branchiostoma belcheri]|nr:biological adhesion [Branchiostoma belcheri]